MIARMKEWTDFIFVLSPYPRYLYNYRPNAFPKSKIENLKFVDPAEMSIFAA